MSLLRIICITNNVFRSTTERRGTLDTYFWQCSALYPYPLCTYFPSTPPLEKVAGWDEEAMNDVITAMIRFSAKLHDIESLIATRHSPSCLWSTDLTLSVLICTLLYLWPGSHSRDPRDIAGVLLSQDCQRLRCILKRSIWILRGFTLLEIWTV